MTDYEDLGEDLEWEHDRSNSSNSTDNSVCDDSGWLIESRRIIARKKIRL